MYLGLLSGLNQGELATYLLYATCFDCKMRLTPSSLAYIMLHLGGGDPWANFCLCNLCSVKVAQQNYISQSPAGQDCSTQKEMKKLELDLSL